MSLLGNEGVSTSHNPMGLRGLLQGQLYLRNAGIVFDEFDHIVFMYVRFLLFWNNFTFFPFIFPEKVKIIHLLFGT
jgi:hypothetical protein